MPTGVVLDPLAQERLGVIHLARHVRLGSESPSSRATAPPGLTLGAGGRILPAVTDATLPSSQPAASHRQAAKPQTATRDGAPHPGVTAPVHGDPSQLGSTGATGSRSAPRRSGGFRRLPPVSAEERRRRADWGRTWGATMREIVAEHKAKRS